MTADELMRLPDDGYRYELDEGRLVRMPPSNFRSSQVAMELARLLMNFIREHDLGIYAGEAGGVLLGRDPDTVRAPDFSFISRERAAARGSGYFPGAPDLVVEVLSPSDRTNAVLRKVRQYLAAGARLVVVIDPEDRSVTAHHADGRVELLGEHDTLDLGAILPGCALSLDEIWVD
jgi:Uma2 family endonuclease